MRRRQITFWLEQSVASQISDEASAHYPCESGGVLMGYWADQANLVATTYIGPGPNAHHAAHEFTPDHDWQIERIAEHYEASGRLDTYLGDWHSHPDTNSHHLSKKDRLTLWRISRHTPAQAPTPIMLIASGSPDDWSAAAWVGKSRRIFSVQIWLEVTRASARIF